MAKFLLGAGFAGLGLIWQAGVALAGPIENACLQSNRNAASHSLCACIQQVADITLGGSDQQLAATFFKDPDRAQKVHLSKTSRDGAFWTRYVTFGQQAQLACAG